jgi:ureidoglycolate lyase
MSPREITVQPLTADAFAPFGEVLDASGAPDRIINAGLCGRHHDLAKLDFGPDGRAGISIFNAQACRPLTGEPFLVIVAPDEGDTPGTPLAFLTAPHQGVNFHRGTWHGVLTPLAEPGLFAVVDRIGTSPNLDEYPLDPPYVIKG